MVVSEGCFVQFYDPFDVAVDMCVFRFPGRCASEGGVVEIRFRMKVIQEFEASVVVV